MMLSPAEYAYILPNDFMSFTQRSFHELNPQTRFVSGPHIEMIATKLEAVRRGEVKRLILNLPPRGLKSHCASIAFPAWCLGRNPTMQIICASYGQDLADKFARDCRTIMTSDWYQRIFPTRLANRQAVADFTTTAEGRRKSTSVGGVLTGFGGDLIVIDDPLKPDQALSATQRKAVNDWYDDTLYTRLNDKADGSIVIIMQRLHQNDLVGHVLEKENWEVLSFPAIAERHETHIIVSPLGTRLFTRKVGDALHPDRESLAIYAEIRRTIGEYNFLSQYQQNPAHPGGAMIKLVWLKFYEPGEQPANFSRIVQSWDTANKATEISDYSVCTTWGVDGKNYYLLHVFRQKLNYPDLKRAVLAEAARHNAGTILIEDKASGTQLIQDLKSEFVNGVTEYKPPSGSDKVMRLHAQAAMFENGRVFLPRTAPWLADYIHELTSFPGPQYNDQVDSTTQFLDYIRSDDSLEVWIKLGQM
ncbi:MAG: phage terminase large subunit [Xanthobacteraceae bacterium]|jgi:predicted phage terminase large subunit-like protein